MPHVARDSQDWERLAYDSRSEHAAIHILEALYRMLRCDQEDRIGRLY